MPHPPISTPSHCWPLRPALLLGLGVTLLLVVSCGANETGSGGATSNDTAVADGGVGNQQASDAPDGTHAGPALAFGVGSAPLFAPMGISTAGYGQTPKKTAPRSPLASNFQATTTLLHPPTAQAVYLKSVTTDLLIVQTDLIGIHQRFFVLVAERLEAAIPGFSRDRLILAANHTHSGPGHIFDAFFAATVVDVFIGEIASRMADAIVQSAKLAVDDAKDTGLAEVGYALLSNKEMHSDRRCENPDYQNDRMAVLVVREKDKPTRKVTLVNYAMHGTVFSAKDAMLSGDAPRAVERALVKSTGGPVLFLQSWGGDMSPGHPAHLYKQTTATSAPLPNLDRLEVLGRSAQLTLAGLDKNLTWLPDPELAVQSREYAIDHATLKYDKGEFDQPNGAILCGFSKSGCKDDPPVDMSICISLPKGGGPQQIRFTAARIGPLALVTLPGEPVTTLGEAVMNDVQNKTSAKVAFVLGYAQDYTGYLLFADDWKAGGYEGSFNYWGPKQGRFVADAAVATAALLFDGIEPKQQAVGALTYKMPQSLTYKPISALEPAAIVTNVAPNVTLGQIVTFAVNGAKDPWFGSPKVRLETETGEAVASAVAVIVQLSVMPSFMDNPVKYGGKSDARRFEWTVTLRTQLRTPGLFEMAPGRYRLVVEMPGQAASVYSDVFEVSAPKQ
ncbi:MAG: neutral/alkaline non-lysosomal ceramidase N-terminal domain-containing protein [Myxococcales bacterium]|nr:neutral/alkaline non-lysosomal ceramidase N-terminal domain-containing protein [Myxococcales bacterium]